jgi:hypothetical protein
MLGANTLSIFSNQKFKKIRRFSFSASIRNQHFENLTDISTPHFPTQNQQIQLATHLDSKAEFLFTSAVMSQNKDIDSNTKTPITSVPKSQTFTASENKQTVFKSNETSPIMCTGPHKPNYQQSKQVTVPSDRLGS